MVLKYEDLAGQPSEQLAGIEERFNISLGSKEVSNHAHMSSWGWEQRQIIRLPEKFADDDIDWRPHQDE